MAARKAAPKLNLRSVREIQNAGDGDYADGGGLILRVRGPSAVWILRYTAPSGKRREMGFGVAYRNNAAVTGESLSAALAAAAEARGLRMRGVDPIEQRKADKAATREAATIKKAESKRDQLTLARAARIYHERVIEPQRTAHHSAQWIGSLERHLPAELWHKPIALIEAPELLDAVAALQARLSETASRVRQRLEAVFDDAEFRKQCHGNPARAIRRKLRESKKGGRRGSLAALPYTQVSAFVRQLRAQEGIAARALEFGMLTATRTGEIVGCQWSEMDSGVWTVPAARMKGGEAHVVYLSHRALEILETVKGLDKRWVFPSPSLDGGPLSNMAMLALLRRMGADQRTTAHGLCRSTFSTWANELGVARPDVIEACLAHQEQNRVRAAYNRAQFNAERQELLTTWAEYLDGKIATPQVALLSPLRIAA